MESSKKFGAIILAIFTVVLVAEACNEAICGPRVSKCMLIKCCSCDMSDLKNCSCCRECQICLKSLYTECCSCVGLCPPPDPEDDLEKSSTVEDLPDPIPDLFDVLTEEEDPHQRWSTYTFAVDLDKLLFAPGTKMPAELDMKIVKPGEKIKSEKADGEEHLLGIRNCTVAYFSKCLSIRKCKESCKSMGAAKYRWFHEHGCCECVGSSCYDYGLNSPKCLLCPEGMDQSDEPYYHRWRENSVYEMEDDYMSKSDGYIDSV